MRSTSPTFGYSLGCAAFVAGFFFAAVAPLRAEEPLHQRIDQAIRAAMPDFDQQAAPIASDAEFLRRIYLDLVGTIPTSAEARAFLDDSAADKRAKLIDKLLASPEHARHLQQVFDAVLMERRPDRNVARNVWQQFLYKSFLDNKPWDELVRELLAADTKDTSARADRAVAKFYLERDAEPHLMTRDISRLFLGMNLQCAQCHDSPIVEDYKQDHYYGVFAFVSRTSILKPKGSNQGTLAEKAEGEVTYQSVFDPKKATKSTGPRMPGGTPITEPKLEKGKEYEPAKAGSPPVPKFSRRAQLALQVANADNAAFKRTSANRFWALMMGRGLVHPLDLDHSTNPASHPELLNLLADEFAAMKFNTRELLRQLALSQTYQRSSELPAGAKEVKPETFAVGLLKPLTPEQLAWCSMQATGLTDVERKASKTPDTLYAKLSANVPAFVAAFGKRPGEPVDQGFETSLDQTLFVAHGSLLRTWLAPSKAGNLLGRLEPIKESDAVAEELYLSVMTRQPGDEERREVADYLKDRTKDRSAAMQELAWALLASAEFRFNH